MKYVLQENTISVFWLQNVKFIVFLILDSTEIVSIENLV